MNWSDIGELISHVDSSWALFAIIVFAIVWFFRNPLEKLIDGILPGEHASLAKTIIKNVFVFGLLGIILVSVLQAHKQSNEFDLEKQKIQLPVEMKKLDIKSEDLYGLTSDTINALLSEFQQEEIGLDTDLVEARFQTRTLINRVLRMKGDLIYALNANESIRKRAIEALNLLDSGNLDQAREIHDSMAYEGVFDNCPSDEPVEQKPAERAQSTPTMRDKTNPVSEVPLSRTDELLDDDLKKLRFLLATYGNWKIVTGASGVKIYPSIKDGAELMILRERECASEVDISSLLDEKGFHYSATEREGNCFAGKLQDVEIKGANVLGLKVDSLLAQYKRIDAISNDVYDDVVYSELELFEPTDNIDDDFNSLEQIRYILEDSYSQTQIKFLGKLYFVYGLTTEEIRDIPFPNNNVAFELELKIEAAQGILLADSRTNMSPLVNKPITTRRIGYGSEETKITSPSTGTSSTPSVAPPSPPTMVR